MEHIERGQGTSVWGQGVLVGHSTHQNMAECIEGGWGMSGRGQSMWGNARDVLACRGTCEQGQWHVGDVWDVFGVHWTCWGAEAC